MSTNKSPPSETSSAPESGTVRDATSGNQPAKGNRSESESNQRKPADDPSSAPESGTVREA